MPCGSRNLGRCRTCPAATSAGGWVLCAATALTPRPPRCARCTRHVVQTDHKCVLDSCRYLQQRGFDVTYLPVQARLAGWVHQLRLWPPRGHSRFFPLIVYSFIRMRRPRILTPAPPYPLAFSSPQKNGLIDLQQLADTIRPDTALVGGRAGGWPGCARGRRGCLWGHKRLGPGGVVSPTTRAPSCWLLTLAGPPWTLHLLLPASAMAVEQ